MSKWNTFLFSLLGGNFNVSPGNVKNVLLRKLTVAIGQDMSMVHLPKFYSGMDAKVDEDGSLEMHMDQKDLPQFPTKRKLSLSCYWMPKQDSTYSKKNLIIPRNASHDILQNVYSMTRRKFTRRGSQKTLITQLELSSQSRLCKMFKLMDPFKVDNLF